MLLQPLPHDLPPFIVSRLLISRWLGGYPGGSDSKESSCNAGVPGSIPGLGRSPGEENSYPLQYSLLRESQGQRSLLHHSPWGHKELDTTEWLNMHASYLYPSVQFSSVAQLFPTLCDPMNHSTPGLPVHHQLPESTKTHVHWVSDAIQPSHSLSSPSPTAFNLSQHQGLFQWVSSSHQVAKVLEFQLQHQSFQWRPRTDLL